MTISPAVLEFILTSMTVPFVERAHTLSGTPLFSFYTVKTPM